MKVWVQLPPAAPGAGAAVEAPGLPYPPAPVPRAVARRALRGDPRRAQELTRGPDPQVLVEACRAATRVRCVSRWLRAVSMETTAAGVAALLRRFGAEAVRPVRTLRASPFELQVPVPPAPGAVPTGGAAAPPAAATANALDYGPSAAQVAQIQVDQLHGEGFTGRGVRVLVLDTGFRTSHASLAALDVAAEHDFVFDDAVTANEPNDAPGQDGHGTGVLAVLAGYAPGELIGPAYGATVLLAKTEVISSETRVEEDHFVAALEWGEALGADVATASLSYLAFDDGFTYLPAELDGDTAVTTRAMDAAAALGVVALCAVGNRGAAGAGSLGTPADADSALAVGAVDATGAVAAFSSRGPTADGRIKPDVCARGVLVRWAVAAGGYGDASGTSLATPLTAGAAALVLEAHPEWSGQQVEEALRQTATQAAAPDNDRGYGIVRAHDAVFDVMVPQWPFPFVEVAPAAGATGDGSPVLFSWRRARDLQDPTRVRYAVQAASTLSFADTLALFQASTDTFRVISAFPETTYAWRVLASDPQGHVRPSPGRWFHSTQVLAGPPAPDPRSTWLAVSVPRPNPFNPAVGWTVELTRPAQVEAQLFDAAGRRVRRLLAAASWAAGSHALRWDGRDDTSCPVASGVYLARLRATDAAGTTVERTVRMTLAR